MAKVVPPKPVFHIISRERPDGSWAAAIAEYESQEVFEYYEGDRAQRIVDSCPHRHQRPDNKAIKRCHCRMAMRLKYYLERTSP